MPLNDNDLLLINDSQDSNEAKKIKYSTLKSNITGDSGNNLQAVTDNGNTTTNGATFGAGNISLNADGSAKFSSTVDTFDGWNPTSTDKNGIRLSAGNYFAQVESTTQSTVNIATYKRGADDVIAFKADGSATFAGRVTGTNQIRSEYEAGNQFFGIAKRDDLVLGNLSSANLSGAGFTVRNTTATAGAFTSFQFQSQDPTNLTLATLIGFSEGSGNNGGLMHVSGSNNSFRFASDGSGLKIGNTYASPNITLNADGSASLAGGNIELLANANNVSRIKTSFGDSLGTDSWVNITANGNWAFWTGVTATPEIHAGVSATGGGYFTEAIHIGGTKPTNAVISGVGNIQLNADGSGTFVGTVQSGGNAFNGTATGSAITQSGAVFASAASNSSLFTGYTTGNNTATFRVQGDGSATFAGDVELRESGVTALKLSKDTDGSLNLYGKLDLLGAGNAANTVLRVYDGSGDKVTFQGDGSATFTGNITAGNVTFSEPDGSTYDIRERIEEAITRITAVETADISDDQEHSALLTLIASMATRITALEQQLAGGN